MSSNILETVTEELFTLTPSLFRNTDRKLVKSALYRTRIGISELHLEILILLHDSGTLHTAEIGDRLNIARSQMTRLIDKLINLNLVKRSINKADRRQTNILLTAKGCEFLNKDAVKIKNAIKESLSGLTENDLLEISDSLRKLHTIFARLV
jgi:DNA-binding MarR family transcriptional regulator